LCSSRHNPDLLITRYFRLSKNWLVSFILAGVAVAAFVGDALATWSVLRFTSLNDRPKLKTFATIWFTAAVAADLLIAVALIWFVSFGLLAFSHEHELIECCFSGNSPASSPPFPRRTRKSLQKYGSSSCVSLRFLV